MKRVNIRTKRFALITMIVMLILANLSMLAKPVSAESEQERSSHQSTVYEAEAQGNTLHGKAKIRDKAQASGGKIVGDMFGGAELIVNNVTVPQAGKYKVTVYYIKGEQNRQVYIRENDSAYQWYSDFPTGPNWDTILSYNIYLDLQDGSNSISFWDGGEGHLSIDIDKIEVSAMPSSLTPPPIVYPAAGDYDESQFISFSNEMEDVNFYYTIDGSRPTIQSIYYDGPFLLDRSAQIRAIAMKDGFAPSEESIFAYTIRTKVYEAEAVENEFSGTRTSDCGSCSEGRKVGYMLNNSQLKINDIEVNQTGRYRVTVYYSKGDGNRHIYIRSNENEFELYDDFPAGSNWDKILSHDIYLNLNQGSNSITFWDGGLGLSAFDIDKIELVQDSGAAASAPQANQISGSYNEGLSVSLSSATEGAGIYYTIDGTRPTTRSLRYDKPIELNRSTIIKAIAIKDGLLPSELKEFSYTIGTTVYEAEVAENELSGHASIRPCYYCSGGMGVRDLYSGSKLKINNIEVPETGKYRVTVYYIKGESDRTAPISVNNGPFIKYDLPVTGNWTKVRSHDIYLNLNEGNNSITISDEGWKSIDIDKIEVSQQMIAAAPSADVPAGKYAEPINVQLTSETEGVLIYYSMNGQTPTDKSFLYEGAITVNKNTTIKAIAMKDGLLTSEEVVLTYTIGVPNFTVYEAESASNELPESMTFPGQKAKIVASSASSGRYRVSELQDDRALIFKNVVVPATGNYKIKVFYSIGDGKERNVYIGANIGYSTDPNAYRFYNNFPKTDSWNRISSKEITVALTSGSNTITFWSGGAGSYSIDIDKIEVSVSPVPDQVAAPAANVPEGIYPDGQLVALTSATADADIYYTTDGSVPTMASTRFTDPIQVNETMTVRAIAVKDGLLSSEIASFVYKIGNIAVYEAESPDNEFIGRASTGYCQGCSGQQKVGGIYYGGGLKFRNIEVDEAGWYKLAIYYLAGDPSRALDIKVNDDGIYSYVMPLMKDWNTVGELAFDIQLNAGNNTILFTDAGLLGPDLDRIEVGPKIEPNTGTPEVSRDLGALIETKQVNSITSSRYEEGMTLSNGLYTVSYYADGYADYDWNGVKKMRGIYSTVRLDNGDTITNKDYSQHLFAMNQVTPIDDDFGKGVQVVFINQEPGKPELRQVYRIYADLNYFLTYVEAADSSLISSNYMAPVVTDTTGGVDVGTANDNRVLIIPYDNEGFAPFFERPINNFGQSYEVTAVYDSDSRNGVILGSVTHDTWKTGIEWKGSGDAVNLLKVYGGASSFETRDLLPHGSISGTKLESPTIFIGYYDDYRTGMEQYGEANAVIAPRLSFAEGVSPDVPIGWNSWSAFPGNLTYEDVVKTSDYFKDNLSSFSNDGVVYINLDYNTLNYTQQRAAANYIKANGQKPGIYWKPFVFGGNVDEDMDMPVEGTNGRYTYRDIILKDADGNVLPKYSNSAFYAIDPTHPGTKMLNEYYLNMYMDMGFQFIKLDFMSHGAMEGKHYDSSITTGTQAYNYGMQYISDLVKEQMFISESIAPMFPSQYAHSRRISCDVHAGMGEVHYLLNNLTNGWWQHGTIYPYTDPDHMPFAKAENLEQARTRMNASVISGTVLLNSDKVDDPKGSQLMQELLTNPEMMDIATKGKVFRPVHGNNVGSRASDMFSLNDSGTYYLAVFNYNNANTEKTIDLERAGLAAGNYTALDVWSGESAMANGTISVQLTAYESRIYKLTAIDRSVAAPTANPAPGTYSAGQSVVLSTATEGAAIRYTMDGTEPTEASSLYSGAIQVNSSTTIKAIATIDGYNTSETATFVYSITSNGNGNSSGNNNGEGDGNGQNDGDDGDNDNNGEVDNNGSEEMSFSDIADHWAKEAIEDALRLGIIAGYPDQTFRPNGKITRVEFVAMLARALRLEGAGGELYFQDNKDIQAWARPVIAQAVQAGIINGYSDQTFRPKAPITRSEMAAIIIRSMEVAPVASAKLPFKDAAQIPQWAKGYVAAAYEEGIMSGRTKQTFVPEAQASRAEAVAVILRMLGKK